MADLIAQIRDIDTQLTALQAQKALLAQQLAEDPQRTASRDEVAFVVAASTFWRETIKAVVSTALHPDWVTIDLPLEGLGGTERLARLLLAQQLIRRGAEQGYSEEIRAGGGVLRQEVPGRVLVHRERAEAALAAVAQEFGW